MRKSHIRSRKINVPQNQTGAVLLLFILLLVVGASTLLVSKLNKAATQYYRDDVTMKALLKAKEALVGWSVTYSDTNNGQYGFLPCPDLDETTGANEGSSHGPCGSRNVNAIGRLPWRSLEMEPVRDSGGECLWYVVSGQYKNGTVKTNMLNEDSNGYFILRTPDDLNNITGDAPDNRAVALIIAPGSVVGAQDRSSLSLGTEVCGGNFTIDNYLDCYDQDTNSLCSGAPTNIIDNSNTSGSADVIDTFINGEYKDDPGSNNEYVNDRIIAITRADIFQAIIQRNDFYTNIKILTNKLAVCIASYGDAAADNRLPWAAPIDLSASDYREDNSYDDESGRNFGRLPHIVDTTDISTGKTSGNLFTVASCTSLTTEDVTFWKNWKDHFFYSVSPDFNPSVITIPASCSSNCIEVNLNNYAAVVIFSGTRSVGQTRNAPHTTPIDTDTKNVIANYLENGNEDGDLIFTSPTDTKDDLVYCIQEDLTVVEC